MKKILFFEPFLNNIYKKGWYKSKEPDLPTLRAIYAFKKKGYAVEFIDAKTDNFHWKQLIEKIKNSDFVFINVKSYNVLLVHRLLKSLDEKILNKIYLFGQYIESEYKNLKWKTHFIDSDIYLIPEIFEKVRNKKYIVLHVKKRNLDNIPLLDIDEMQKRDYYTVYPNNILKRVKWGFMNLTEGCPYNCIFCSRTLRISRGKKVITFSLDEAVKRTVRLLKYFDAIRFLDDDFFADPKFALNYLKKLKNHSLKFPFQIQIRADKVATKHLQLLKDVGCAAISLGVESASRRILRILNKGEDLDRIDKVIRLIKKYNFNLITYFMIGNPSETIVDVKKSIDYSFKIKPNVLQIAFFTPYHGSPFYEQHRSILEKENNTTSFYHYGNIKNNFSKIPSKILSRIYFYWYLKYYLFHLHQIFMVFFQTFGLYPLRLFRTLKLKLQALLKEQDFKNTLRKVEKQL